MRRVRGEQYDPLDGGQRAILGILTAVCAGTLLWGLVIALIAWVFWG
jgi:hypothetical protein